jgi:hypothetical protein
MKKKYVLIIIVLAVLGIAAIVYIVLSGGAVLSGGTDIDRTSGRGNDREIGQPVPYEKPENDTDTEAETLQTEQEIFPSDSTGDPGETLHIYTYDDSFQYVFNEFYLDHKTIPDGIDVKFTIASTEDFESDLLINISNAADLSEDEKVDIFLLEPEFAAKFINGDYAMPLSSLGITENELTNQFEFTKELTSDREGVQKGLMYEICPEVFIYRRSLALTVLGTDEPEEVAKFLIGDEYNKTAQKMKERGYTMLGSYEEDFRLFTEQSDEQIVNDTGDLVLPEAWENWAEHTKEFVDNGYAKPSEKYNSEWIEGLNSGKVFGYIGDCYYAEYYISESLENKGDFAACTLPVPIYQGGSMLCAAEGTDNPELVADIMRTLTTDPDVLQYMAERTLAVTNTVSGMTEIANGSFQSNLFIGVNPYVAYVETAKSITGAKSQYAPYNGLYLLYIKHMSGYFEGERTFEECRQAFLKDAVIEYYLNSPEIDYRLFLVQGDYQAPKTATPDELDAARQIILTRLEQKSIEDGDCTINYQRKTLTVTFTNTVELTQSETHEFLDELKKRAIITFREGNETDPGTGVPAGVTASNIILDGNNIEKAEYTKISDAAYPEWEQWVVFLKLDKEGTKVFAEATKKAMQNETAISIWLDDVMLSAPYVNDVITEGTMFVSGNLDINSAKKVADIINAGSLPFELELIEALI